MHGKPAAGMESVYEFDNRHAGSAALYLRFVAASCAVLVCLGWWMGGAIAASITIQDPGTFVVDPSSKIDEATKDRIKKLLKDLEAKTTAQVKVLVVDTTGDEDIFDFSQRHYVLWKLGTKEKSNGALIVLAIGDRKVRVHMGKGLEGVLPDSWAGTTSRAISQQYFKNGQYAAGVEELAKRAAVRVAEDAGVKLEGNPQIPLNQPALDTGWSPGVLPVIFFLIILFLILRSGRRRGSRYRRTWGGPFFGGWPGGSSSGGWGGSSSGWSGGFGGGGFGGGGGSFGGGGDSGGGGGGASW